QPAHRVDRPAQDLIRETVAFELFDHGPTRARALLRRGDARLEAAHRRQEARVGRVYRGRKARLDGARRGQARRVRGRPGAVHTARLLIPVELRRAWLVNSVVPGPRTCARFAHSPPAGEA